MKVVASDEATMRDEGLAVRGDLRASVDAHQRRRVESTLAKHQWNWTTAARELGLHRAHLVRLARRLGVRSN